MFDVDNIPYGHANAVQRPANQIMDRILRGKIEKANRNDDCIINVGNGYYRPVPGDVTDESELNEYLSKELSRARNVLAKRAAMQTTFERWREVGVLTKNTG